MPKADKVPELRGRTIVKANLGYEHANEFGPEAMLELWFKDGTYFAVSFQQMRPPDAAIVLSHGRPWSPAW